MNIFASSPSQRGFYVLLATEFWERFSFFSMSFLLALYAADSPEKGGLGWSEEKAIGISGFYSLAVYLTPLFGGMLADKYLGRKHSAATGAALIALGHIILALHFPGSFYLALGILIVGSGFYQACMLSIIKELYEENLVERANAYSYFYMFINLGGLAAGLASGLVAQQYSYHAAFSMAGFGMTIGLFVFLAGSKLYLRPYGNKPLPRKKETIAENTPTWPRKKLALFYYYTSVFGLACATFGIITSGTLTLYINNYVDRNIFGFTIPPTWFNSLDSIGFLIWVPLITLFYKKRSLRTNDTSVSIPSRFTIGLLIHFVSFSLLTLAAYQHTFLGNNSINPLLIAAYFLLSNAGWVMLDSGVLVASSSLVPQNKLGFYMGIQNLSMGLGFYIGAGLGVLSVKYDAFSVFSGLSLSLLLTAVLTFALKNRLHRAAH